MPTNYSNLQTLSVFARGRLPNVLWGPMTEEEGRILGNRLGVDFDEP